MADRQSALAFLCPCHAVVRRPLWLLRGGSHDPHASQSASTICPGARISRQVAERPAGRLPQPGSTPRPLATLSRLEAQVAATALDLAANAS
jgi:hypothetical protein